MLTYISFYLILALISFIFSYNKKSLSGYTYVSILFVFFSSSRYLIGTDYGNYEYIFYQIYNGDIAQVSNREYLYYQLMVLFSNFTGEYFYFSFVISVITFSILMYVNHRFSVYPFLSFSLLYFSGFYFVIYNVTRQGLAVAIFAYVCCSVMKNKKSLILSFFMPLIHASSIILSFFSLFLLWGLGKRVFLRYLCLFILLSSLIISPIYILEVLSHYFNLASFYLQHADDKIHSSSGSGFMLILWFSMLFGICFFDFNKMNQKLRVLAVLSVLSIFISFISYELLIFGRIELYFSWAKYLLIVNYAHMNIFSGNKFRFIVGWNLLILISLLACFQFYVNYNALSQGVYPYNNYIF